jgi:ATP-binding cassette subfamily B protein
MDPMQRAYMRSFRPHDEVAGDQKLKPGTVRRIVGFARPYRRELAIFIGIVIADAIISVATPLLFGRIIDDGIARQDVALVTNLALVVAGLAIFSAGLSLAQRFYSSRIGEGLIYDMRSKVFDHVQRMPIAFFTRTQTGALVSRLNNDVIGAQQAFTSTLSGVVSNVIGLVLTVAVMLRLSWQITLVSLVLLPVFILPARRVGLKLQAITREGMALNASMNTTMTERFNVSGALLVSSSAGPTRRRPTSARGPDGSATSASSRRCTAGRSSWP